MLGSESLQNLAEDTSVLLFFVRNSEFFLQDSYWAPSLHCVSVKASQLIDITCKLERRRVKSKAEPPHGRVYISFTTGRQG